IEEQSLADQSFDAIVLNDVVEHLPDPAGTLRHCGRLLKPDGMLIVQMPALPERTTYEELVHRHDPFLPLMHGMVREHLHLFTRRSAERMLHELGFHAVEFLPAIFAHDMYLVAARQAVIRLGPDQEAVRPPTARFVQAMLDLDERRRVLESRLSVCEAD